MGAKISAAMIRAKSLVLEFNHTAYSAAKATGLTTGAVSRTAWYKAHTATLPPDRVQEQARELVVDQGMSAYAAAQMLGVAQSTITRAPWYVKYKEQLKKQLEGGNDA